MNEQHIEDIITTLYDMVQDARALPLGADKCILERDKVLDMLDEIIAQLPVELKQARTIVESRNELIGQARREAEGLIRQAQEKADQMVEQEAIYQEARRQCQEMFNKTQTRLAELRKASNEYMDDALRRTEEAIALSLEDVKDTRAKFNALVEAQEKRVSEDAVQTEA
jgi:DNA anti-recombination protein RmuC